MRSVSTHPVAENVSRHTTLFFATYIARGWWRKEEPQNPEAARCITGGKAPRGWWRDPARIYKPSNKKTARRRYPWRCRLKINDDAKESTRNCKWWDEPRHIYRWECGVSSNEDGRSERYALYVTLWNRERQVLFWEGKVWASKES